MKKIVHIIDSLNLGGAEMLLVSTIRQMPDWEHHVVVLENNIAFPEIHQLATIYCVHHSGWLHLYRSSRRVRSIVASVHPFVVHAHLFLAALITRLAVPRFPNLVYSIHNLYSETVFTKLHLQTLEKLIYRNQHKLIAVSEYILNDYKRVVRKCRKGTVLYNFIDPIFFSPNTTKPHIAVPRVLQEWVAVGSLKAQKNYSGMIALFKQLHHSKLAGTDARLHIYGEGSMKSSLEQEAEKKQAPVLFKGRTNNMANLLPKYDAYISTSIYEGYGIAPMEALACGLPIFISDIPVYREVYGGYAFYIDLTDHSGKSFLSAVEAYQQLTPQQKKLHQQQGMEHAAAMAGDKAYINRLLDLYEA